jgi:hypothetical protein
LRPLLNGTRWLLLPQLLDQHKWDAWQFNSVDGRRAALLAFNNQSPESECILRPKALDPTASYAVDGDNIEPTVLPGEALTREGLQLRLDQPEGSAMVWLRALTERPSAP